MKQVTPLAASNKRSRRIPEKLGFKQEGVLIQADWMRDHFNDLVIYARLASDWQANNEPGGVAF
jgi:ribosomal-protein-serine acetyltransferase